MKDRQVLSALSARQGFPPEEMQPSVPLKTLGLIRMAMVARTGMIDQRKFGVTVAANRGLVADVVTTEAEAEAIAWLDGK